MRDRKGAGIVLGIVFGVVLGVAMDNIGVGIAFEAANRRKDK